MGQRAWSARVEATVTRGTACLTRARPHGLLFYYLCTASKHCAVGMGKQAAACRNMPVWTLGNPMRGHAWGSPSVEKRASCCSCFCLESQSEPPKPLMYPRITETQTACTLLANHMPQWKKSTPWGSVREVLDSVPHARARIAGTNGGTGGFSDHIKGFPSGWFASIYGCKTVA